MWPPFHMSVNLPAVIIFFVGKSRNGTFFEIFLSKIEYYETVVEKSIGANGGKGRENQFTYCPVYDIYIPCLLGS